MSDLTTGGSNASLPPGWVAPHGFPMNKKMLWIGKKPATSANIDALVAAGDDYMAEMSTVCGILDPEWTAPQYDTPDEMESWDTFPMYGGKFSANYKFQHLPAHVVTAHPRWWIHQDGKATRAVGGEPVKRDDNGDYQVVDIDITWDAELGVWRT